MSQDFARQLRDWRGRHKLSQTQAAAKLQLSKRNLQNWEQGRYVPRGQVLLALLAKMK